MQIRFNHAIAAITSSLVVAACGGEGSVDPPPTSQAQSQSATSADDDSVLVDFSTLRLDGTGSNGNRFALDLSILDATGIFVPELFPALEQLSFFDPDGGKGELIEGAGLITRTSDGVFGEGRLLDVPVTGTQTDPQGVIETADGVLTIDLDEQVIDPIKGDFFSSCGEDCVRFDIAGWFEPAAGPTPCLITGTFTAGTPSGQL